MSGEPEVSVIIPTRNRASLLARTLACALAQRDVVLEVIVVDEASDDATPALLRSCADPRLRVVRHDVPKRLPGARNAGIALASAPWVAFCDDDDLWAPTKLRAQLDALAGEGCRWSVTGVVHVDLEDRVVGHGRAVGGDVGSRLRIGNIIPGGGSAVMASTALVREVGGFDESLRACEDYDMWIRLGAASPLAAVDRPLAAYRVSATSMSSDVVTQRRSHMAVLARYGGGDPDDPLVRQVELGYRQYLARTHLRRRARWKAFRDYLDIGVRHRAPSQLAHGVGGLLVPGLVDRWRARRELEEVPASWQVEAEAWLAEVGTSASLAA